MELTFVDNFNRLKRANMVFMASVCEKWSLTQREAAVLLFLDGSPQMDRAVDLVNYCGMVKSHVSVSVNHLESMGCLRKIRDESDHRTVHLKLTEASAPILADLRQAHEKFLEKVLAGVTAEELSTYQTIAMKISANLSKTE